jgi:hypothetical protein
MQPSIFVESKTLKMYWYVPFLIHKRTECYRSDIGGMLTGKEHNVSDLNNHANKFLTTNKISLKLMIFAVLKNQRLSDPKRRLNLAQNHINNWHFPKKNTCCSRFSRRRTTSLYPENNYDRHP